MTDTVTIPKNESATRALCIATDEGLLVGSHDDNHSAIVHTTLSNHHVTSVMAREGVILAGTKEGVFRSEDKGENWIEASQGLNPRYVRWLAYHPDISDLEFAGTEPAALFVSHNGGDSWREASEVAALRDQHGWWLPYSPEAGCVRGFAFAGRRAYAAVEVGGALRSDDGGESWQLAGGSDGNPRFGQPKSGEVHPDVHSVAIHPSSEDLIFAPTGGGLYRSKDGGNTWSCLFQCYCRAIWLDPHDAHHFVFGSANSASGSNGQIWETRNDGETWQTAATGLETPWSNCLVERFVQVDEHLFGVLSNGQLIVSPIGQMEWRYIFADAPHVNAVAVMGE